MLNIDLFEDKKSLRIAQLELAIKKFKEYDQERTVYINKLKQRINDLEKSISENTEINRLKAKIQNQSKEIKNLSQLRHGNKVLYLKNPELF